MGIAKVRTALVTALNTTLQASPLSFPVANIVGSNRPAPHVATNWCTVTFLPADLMPITLGSSGQDLATGIVAINVRTPLNDGESFGLTVVDTLRAAYPAGTRVTFSGQQVEILGIGFEPGRVIDTWWRTDITVQFRAYIQRGV